MVFFFVLFYVLLFIFFFKQKTAYEMRISDWSSDVCSSDLSRCPDMKILSTHRCRPGARPRDPLASAQSDALRYLHRSQPPIARLGQIGRASCRERVCQYV